MDSANWVDGFRTWLPFYVIAIRMTLAVCLGAVVGLEREWRSHPAGLRTHILVSLAAATASLLTIEIAHSPVFQDASIRVDPTRLIEAVTAGVAFLAAGMIVFLRGQVHGLTTGAGLWLAGTIGLASGLGFLQIALLAAILALIVLWLLRILETKIDALSSSPKDDRDGNA